MELKEEVLVKDGNGAGEGTYHKKRIIRKKMDKETGGYLFCWNRTKMEKHRSTRHFS